MTVTVYRHMPAMVEALDKGEGWLLISRTFRALRKLGGAGPLVKTASRNLLVVSTIIVYT